ncbi:MAG TPA: (2Fe-2S)-binding protein, partial [Halieaceae bacterium]|nr:(2Fe-2S)-binding protein [Halieaceae bacterium]
FQANALEAFAADFNVWKHKRPALKIMQMKTDGPFKTGRKWYSQFFATPEQAADIRQEVNGTHYTQGLITPEEAGHAIDDGLPF